MMTNRSSSISTVRSVIAAMSSYFTYQVRYFAGFFGFTKNKVNRPVRIM